ncbi:MAG: leucine-rich repeat domain-containing protein [Clostridia bacterium]|nr:leucine-rich repeat domain-containing protein [Clostridia bacterium]
MKNKKGITLIALIITIIVMLILVGVTINVALNGGLFEKAKTASEQTQVETNKETLYSAVVAAMGTDGTIDYTKLNKEAASLGFTKVQNGVYTKDGYTYTVNDVTGIVTATKTTSGGEGLDNFETVEDSSYFTYSETGETITGLSDAGKAFVTQSAGKSIKLIIPDKNPDNVTITTIGDYAFIDMDTGESIFKGIGTLKIELPTSVTSIGVACFFAADCLTDITLQEVTEIGDNAFADCTGLVNITLPKVIAIGGSAFDGCTNLASIIMTKVTSIGGTAFCKCTCLVKIEIPQTATTVGNDVFMDCTSLTDIYCPGNIFKPEGWSQYWNDSTSSATVHWNTTMPTE